MWALCVDTLCIPCSTYLCHLASQPNNILAVVLLMPKWAADTESWCSDNKAEWHNSGINGTQKCASTQLGSAHLIITRSKTKIDNRARTVKEFQTPTCCREVKRFLNLVNFHPRHLLNLTVVARSLISLTRKDKKIE